MIDARIRVQVNIYVYQCKERECRRQFTVTTKTPLHGTKLDLRVWVCAMVLVLTSSKGLSSVVMARLLGVNQKTAWKMGNAIRELMDDRHGEYPRLEAWCCLRRWWRSRWRDLRQGALAVSRGEIDWLIGEGHGGASPSRRPCA